MATGIDSPRFHPGCLNISGCIRRGFFPPTGFYGPVVGMDAVTVVLEVDRSTLGLEEIPAQSELRMAATGQGWSVHLRSEDAAALGPLESWMKRFTPRRIESHSRLMRADFGALPPAWATLAAMADVRHIRAGPGAPATLTVDGDRRSVQQLVEALRVSGPVDVRQVSATAPASPPLLTGPQREALQLAVRAGYYSIPRPVNLCQLARRAGASPASLSERLRRAEGKVIMRYVMESDADVMPPA